MNNVEKTEKVSAKEKERRNRIFLWTLVVIAVNTLALVFPNFITQSFSMIMTAYALYRMVVWDNEKNRYSRKYYDRAGKPLDKPRDGKKISNWFK